MNSKTDKKNLYILIQIQNQESIIWGSAKSHCETIHAKHLQHKQTRQADLSGKTKAEQLAQCHTSGQGQRASKT